MKTNFMKFLFICFFAMIFSFNNNLYSQDSILDLADDTTETGAEEAPVEEKKYDWRKKLNEQMTTSDMFFSTLPATGDVNLANPEWNVSVGYNYNSHNNILKHPL